MSRQFHTWVRAYPVSTPNLQPIVFFVLGGLLYFSIPASALAGSKLLFVGACCIILSMYGGGFATVPAYLADLFGTQMWGPIHGHLLTAWAAVGILGPVVVNYMREYQLGVDIPREQVYKSDDVHPGWHAGYRAAVQPADSSRIGQMVHD